MLTILLTLTVVIAGTIVFKSSGEAVNSNLRGYASKAAGIVGRSHIKSDIYEASRNLSGLHADLNGTMWIVDQTGKMLVNTDAQIDDKYKKSFGDEDVMLSFVDLDGVTMIEAGRSTMTSKATIKEILRKGYKSGFGTYNPSGAGKRVIAFHYLKSNNWLIGVDVPLDAAYSEAESLKNNILKLCVLIFFVTIISTTIAVKKLIKPYHIQQVNLRKDLEINNDKLKQLYELNSVMQQKLSSGDRYNLISKNILELLKIDRVTLFLLSDDKNYLESAATREDITAEKVSLRIPISKDGGVIAKAFKEKNTVIYHTAEKPLTRGQVIAEDLLQGTDILVGVFTTLPLIVQNKCIGVALADNHLSKSAITQETMDFLGIVMNQAAVAIDNINLYQKLKKYTRDLETTDHLTQVFNFTYFKEQLAQYMDAGTPFSLGVIYISNFSVYNERNGHRAGDIALKRIASILEESIAESDILGRCYGAEFGVIFNNKDEIDSVTELNKITDSIKSISLKGLENLTDNAFSVQGAVLTYDPAEELTCDEFFKKVEDRV